MQSFQYPQKGVMFHSTWPSPDSTFCPSCSWLRLLPSCSSSNVDSGESVLSASVPGFMSAASLMSDPIAFTHLYPAETDLVEGYGLAMLYERCSPPGKLDTAAGGFPPRSHGESAVAGQMNCSGLSPCVRISRNMAAVTSLGSGPPAPNGSSAAEPVYCVTAASA